MPVINVNCVEGLRAFSAGSIDAIVTDPPYELGFMGRAWDKTGIANSVEMWAECLRVLKPGGHLLAFSGTRTYHRMACAIEDAGFELRDQMGWAYGTGFPKSLDVSKAIDAAAGAKRGPGRQKTYADGSQKSGNGRDLGRMNDDAWAGGKGPRMETEPATDAARKWAGWGTALKPAWEPIAVARKPLAGTVAANVLAHGTGALNIDGCRIPGARGACSRGATDDGWGMRAQGRIEDDGRGRFPANLLHDGSPEVVDVLAEASRFFYCSKASKADRGEGNEHPTVKPSDLMRYLVRLVTPPGGIVLDPFAGSGSTGKAARAEGFHFLGFEIDAAMAAFANQRIYAA